MAMSYNSNTEPNSESEQVSNSLEDAMQIYRNFCYSYVMSGLKSVSIVLRDMETHKNIEEVVINHA
jgi:hypothetical protein